MARVFLKFYVTICLFVLGFSIVKTVASGKAYHVLSNDDWLIFIIACGALAISESIDSKK